MRPRVTTTSGGLIRLTGNPESSPFRGPAFGIDHEPVIPIDTDVDHHDSRQFVQRRTTAATWGESVFSEVWDLLRDAQRAAVAELDTTTVLMRGRGWGKTLMIAAKLGLPDPTRARTRPARKWWRG
jgi:hypothetical protein